MPNPKRPDERPTEDTQDMPVADKTAKMTRRNLLKGLGGTAIGAGLAGAVYLANEGGKEVASEHEKVKEEGKIKFVRDFLERMEFHGHATLLEAKQDAFVKQMRTLDPEKPKDMEKLKKAYQELLDIQKRLEATLDRARTEMGNVEHLPEIQAADNRLRDVSGRNATLETLFLDENEKEEQ